VTPPRTVTVVGVPRIGEVAAGTDLAAEIVARTPLSDGDVVVVTSKVVSKAAGLVVRGDRNALVAEHTVREVARRGATRIVRTRTGLTMAAAGLDASNTEPGTVVLLPEDPDGCARALREDLRRLSDRNVAVVVTDTAGRAWRTGQTDIAIGVAGLLPLHDLAGLADSHGVPLAVTAPAVADEAAAAADLVQGKLDRVPVAVLTGLADHVLPAGEHGPGATALVRPPAEDLFGWGAADAVRVAVRRDAGAGDGFPAPDTDAPGLVGDALAALEPGLLDVERTGPATWEARPADGPADGPLAGHGVGHACACAWAAGALVERLRVLAVSTHHVLHVDAPAPGPAPESPPYVVRWTLEAPAGRSPGS
jgi:coenzyme F420-0:L-glutamate ligase/coenzyme F420-1:gamma-L-glutamate ligase